MNVFVIQFISIENIAVRNLFGLRNLTATSIQVSHHGLA